jgi:predicted nuclease of predicted toxin-antitoxin system
LRFKIDENLPEELAQMLHDAGWDASSIVQQQLGGVSDSIVSNVCDAEDRVLVTFDRGFSNIRAYSPAEHAGMVVFRLKRQDKTHVLQVASRLIDALRRRSPRGELWIIHENRIRIRSEARPADGDA